MAKRESDIVWRQVRILQMLHGALLVAQILLVGLFVYLGATNSVDGSEMRPFFPFAVIAVTAFNVFGGRKISQSKLSSIPVDASVEQKLSMYRQTNLFRYALLEGATIFNGIAYLVMGSIVFLFVAAGVVAYFIFLRPTEKDFADDLQLNPLITSAAPIE
jgi:hypothetical protein